MKEGFCYQLKIMNVCRENYWWLYDDTHRGAPQLILEVLD